MTLTTWNIFAADDGKVFFRIEWDSPMWAGDDDIPTDPSATSEIRRITFQNLSTRPWNMNAGSRQWTAIPGTAQTTINVANQHINIGNLPYLSFTPSPG